MSLADTACSGATAPRSWPEALPMPPRGAPETKAPPVRLTTEWGGAHRSERHFPLSARHQRVQVLDPGLTELRYLSAVCHDPSWLDEWTAPIHWLRASRPAVEGYAWVLARHEAGEWIDFAGLVEAL